MTSLDIFTPGLQLFSTRNASDGWGLLNRSFRPGFLRVRGFRETTRVIVFHLEYD
ncbi:MAG: hypothetical protein ACLFVT_06290 [Syntrophobacteria bacterium]